MYQTGFFSCFHRMAPWIMGMICKFPDKSALFKMSEQNSLLRKPRVVFEAGVDRQAP